MEAKEDVAAPVLLEKEKMVQVVKKHRGPIMIKSNIISCIIFALTLIPMGAVAACHSPEHSVGSSERVDGKDGANGRDGAEGENGEDGHRGEDGQNGGDGGAGGNGGRGINGGAGGRGGDGG